MHECKLNSNDFLMQDIDTIFSEWIYHVFHFFLQIPIPILINLLLFYLIALFVYLKNKKNNKKISTEQKDKVINLSEFEISSDETNVVRTSRRNSNSFREAGEKRSTYSDDDNILPLITTLAVTGAILSSNNDDSSYDDDSSFDDDSSYDDGSSFDGCD